MITKRKKRENRKIELKRMNSHKIMVDGYIIGDIDLKKNTITVSRYWSEHVRLTLRVSDKFGDCKKFKEVT